MAKDEVKFTAVGRRKRSTANVILVKGTGKITINGVDVKDIYPEIYNCIHNVYNCQHIIKKNEINHSLNYLIQELLILLL